MAKLLRYPAKTRAQCQWFLRCINPATTTVEHPTLGAVPVCERCREFVAKNGGPGDRP